MGRHGRHRSTTQNRRADSRKVKGTTHFREFEKSDCLENSLVDNVINSEDVQFERFKLFHM